MQRLLKRLAPATSLLYHPASANRPFIRPQSHIATLPELKTVQTRDAARGKGITRMPPFDTRAAQAAIDRVQADTEAFELIYTSNASWPLPSGSHTTVSATKNDVSKVNIAILDSSFNPPHLAHLAIASSSLPPPVPPLSESSPRPTLSNGATPNDGNSSTQDTHGAGIEGSVEPYSARLLVFSVRNIEKTPKKGDATVMQRLEMTVLLAEALAQVEAGSTLGNGEVTEGRDSNRQKMPVAVGILNEPTFVGKSRIIHRFLSSRTSMAPNGAQAATGDHAVHSGGTDSMTARNEHERPTLSFLIGTDTLTRFFDPKFYPMGMDRALHSFFASPTTGVDTASSAEAAGDGSVLVSARRGTTPSDRTLEQDVLANGVAKRWAEAGKVRLLGDGSEGWEEISSTRIREAVGRGDWEEVRRLVPGSVADYIESNGLYRA